MGEEPCVDGLLTGMWEVLVPIIFCHQAQRVENGGGSGMHDHEQVSFFLFVEGPTVTGKHQGVQFDKIFNM